MSKIAPRLRREVTIYVRSTRITRQGKKVDGWQVSFENSPGGMTSESREDAVAYQRGIADGSGMEVVDVIVVER